jgi:hypothetical protein
MSDEEGGVDDRTHQRRNIKPFNGKRASPPDQRQSEQLEAGIARDHVQTRMPGPLRIGGVGVVEIGDGGGEA